METREEEFFVKLPVEAKRVRRSAEDLSSLMVELWELRAKVKAAEREGKPRRVFVKSDGNDSRTGVPKSSSST